MTIAIIETSPYIANRLEDMIKEKNEGVVFKKYSKMDEAMEYLSNPLPGAILMDVRFAGSHFETLFNRFKKIENLTLIVMHQAIDEQSKEKYLSAGVDYLIDLYYDFEKLPLMIKAIIEKGTHKNN